jgi:hypothetical protein
MTYHPSSQTGTTLNSADRRVYRRDDRDCSPLELAHKLAFNRREFLRSAAGVTLGGTLFGSSLLARSGVPQKKRKVVVVTFGGGARDQETFAPEGQENIPHLMQELIPQSTFFTQVVNRGILGHYVATASLATGVYETINNFASLPPEHPTVFEYFRKDLKRPASDAWVVAPSNGFNRIGESSNRLYGPGLGARVILPKHLLTAATAGGADYEHLLRDNYETPFYAPELGGNEFELQQLQALLKLSVDDFKKHARTLSSPDELSVYITRHCTTSTSRMRARTRSISRAFAERTGFALSSGRRFKPSRNMPATPQCLSCPTLAATPMKILAATDFSITARAMRFHARRG